jgi:DNA-binding FrmR family transcriptional regulator
MTAIETLKANLAATMVEIVDNNLAYTVRRREYDQAFADSWNIPLASITTETFVPCLMCGEDVVPRILLSQTNGLKPVFCDDKCRIKHSIMRMRKINESVDINGLADLLIKHGLTVGIGANEKRSNESINRATQKAIMIETNRLLKAILTQLEGMNAANRQA